MAKPPHTGGKMRVFYPVCQVAELAAGYRYTTAGTRLLVHDPEFSTLLSGRYYHSDSSMTAVPDDAAQAPALSGPSCL
jgi:hypothetical protein